MGAVDDGVVEVDGVATKDLARRWEGPMPPPRVPAFKTLVQAWWNWLLAGPAAREGTNKSIKRRGRFGEMICCAGGREGGTGEIGDDSLLENALSGWLGARVPSLLTSLPMSLVPRLCPY